MIDDYTISDPTDGQYEVEIDLSKWMANNKRAEFTEKFNQIYDEDTDFRTICSLNDTILKYTSESLFPTIKKSKKKKVLIIAGNPATHSVAKRMFFYSKTVKVKGQQEPNEIKHHFWGKLEEANLMPEIKEKSLEEAAEERKKLILEGQTSDEYILGLTTFYSFPTPVKPRKEEKDNYPAKYKYGNSQGVEKLFKAVLDKLQKMEYDRLMSQAFSKNAIWVFIQNSSYYYVKSFKRIEYWPLMYGGSSGKDLANILQMP